MPKLKRPRVTASGPIADKSKGQHFLKNPLVVNSIVEKSHLKPTDVVSVLLLSTRALASFHALHAFAASRSDPVLET